MLKSSVCVLIPAFNEEKRIGAVVRDVRGCGFSVFVVDDGSSDKTAEVAKKAGATIIASPKNKGKGAALRLGFDSVVRNGYAGVIVMDADGQHDPADLEAFLSKLCPVEADIVVGNRMKNPQGMPFIRRLTNRVMSTFLSLVARQLIPDSQCGYRALTRESLQRISLTTDRFEIESEILIKAAKKKLKIVSIPVRSVYRDETSHIRPLEDTIRFLRFLFRSLFS